MGNVIRILHVLGNLNRGGAETMVMNLYRNIDRSKVMFDFIIHTNDKCDYTEEIKTLGGKIYSIPQYTGKNHLEYKRAWKDFFKNHGEYKIIHGHVRSTALIYLKIAKQHGLITIAHSHNTSSGRGLSATVKYILQYRLRYIPDFLFACSELAGAWLFGEKSRQKDNYFILNNSIESKKFTYNEEIREAKRNEFSLDDKFVIGHVGRFHNQKNHSFLIDIFKSVHDQNKNACLMMVGVGELFPAIEEKVKKLGLTDNVIFTGIRSDVPELLQAIDVFVFPSLHEGLPLTLIEAQANGLTCFVSDKITTEVGITDLIRYIPLDEPAEYWANQILLSDDKDVRKDMSKELIESGYDIKNNSKWLEDFYLKLSPVSHDYLSDTAYIPNSQ